jgi:hypothetical protein
VARTRGARPPCFSQTEPHVNKSHTTGHAAAAGPGRRLGVDSLVLRQVPLMFILSLAAIGVPAYGIANFRVDKMGEVLQSPIPPLLDSPFNCQISMRNDKPQRRVESSS